MAYTITDFCRAHSISRSFFFKLQSNGEAPRVMRAGRRIMISREAAAEWRREREAA